MMDFNYPTGFAPVSTEIAPETTAFAPELHLFMPKLVCYIYNAQRNAEAKKTNRIRCAFSFAKVNMENVSVSL